MRRSALAAVALGALAAPAAAHQGNPDYESLVTRTPDVPGLRVQVVNGDDSLQVVNRGPRELVVVGYEDEPYVRMKPGGVVEVNQNATATYLNAERYSGADVPAGVDPKAPPRWKVVARNGRYEFHDHRIHWMNERDPPEIADEAKRQEVFDWKVPVRVGATTTSIDGTLFWRGRQDEAPAGAYVAGGGLLVAGVVLVVVVRRRRRSVGGAQPGPAAPREEAW
jgi:hypothetical protein